jgi:protein TonB
LGSAANPLPRYPEIARERGWEGVVLLTVGVAADGRAETIAVGRSSGHAVLDQAALEAVRRWRFAPARRAGVPVAGTAAVPIRFRLED